MSTLGSNVYPLAVGRNYNSFGNNNQVINFRATLTAGSTAISVGTDVFARVTAILAQTGPTGIAAITGPGVSMAPTGYVPATATGTNTLLLGTGASISGSYQLQVYDATVPSSEQAPVTAFHVLAGPSGGTAGAGLSFRSAGGQTVSIPYTGLAPGAVYSYQVCEVLGMTGMTGSILGIAASLKPLFMA